MVIFKVVAKNRSMETLFNDVASVSYVPAIGDRIGCFKDRVGKITERLLEYDQYGNFTATFTVTVELTNEERIERWKAMAT